jgi:hypothetical protein
MRVITSDLWVWCFRRYCELLDGTQAPLQADTKRIARTGKRGANRDGWCDWLTRSQNGCRTVSEASRGIFICQAYERMTGYITNADGCAFLRARHTPHATRKRQAASHTRILFQWGVWLLSSRAPVLDQVAGASHTKIRSRWGRAGISLACQCSSLFSVQRASAAPRGFPRAASPVFPFAAGAENSTGFAASQGREQVTHAPVDTSVGRPVIMLFPSRWMVSGGQDE